MVGRERSHMKLAAVAVLAAGCTTQSLLGIEKPDADYWKGYFVDMGEVVCSPREWERRDWLVFGGIVGSALVVYGQDARIRDAAQSSHTPFSEDLAVFSERFGDEKWLIPGLGLAYGLAYACDDPRLKEAALLGVEGFVVAGTLNGALKFLFGRRRPNVASGPDDFTGPGRFTGLAMPSGHTAVAFAVATSFSLEYRNPWVTTLAYVLAGLVGWSRVHDDAHWGSDVIIGAAVGTFTVRGMFRARARRKAVTKTSVARHYFGDLTGGW